MWRFRKSFSPLPGVRLTLSPSGVSTSVGIGPLRLTAGHRGTAFTANIPGTGLSFRQTLGVGARQHHVPVQSQATFDPAAPTPPLERELEDIKSAGSGTLTTPGLAEYKRLLEHAQREHSAISRELRAIRTKEAIDVKKYIGWKNGWLLRRVFKMRFQQLKEVAEDSTARRLELDEQETLSRLQTQMDLPQAITSAFYRMCDEFSLLSMSDRIWDTVGQRATNRVTERTTAAKVIDRKLVSFCLGSCELIESEWKVPHLENANGGDLYFYPAFVLYFISTESFALLEYKEVQLMATSTRFIEEESIPTDSKAVGQTWAKANKDGSPDLRFKNNYQIPIVEYGKLLITSPTGMNEEYMVSNNDHTQVFAKAWREFANAISAGV